MPRLVISNHKPKALRKLIQHHFKRIAGITDVDRECMFRFFDLLKSVYNFEAERFSCALGVILVKSTHLLQAH